MLRRGPGRRAQWQPGLASRSGRYGKLRCAARTTRRSLHRELSVDAIEEGSGLHFLMLGDTRSEVLAQEIVSLLNEG